MEIAAVDPHEFLVKCLDAHREGDRLRKEGSVGLANEYREAAEKGYNTLLNRTPTHASALRMLALLYQQRNFNGLCINLCIAALRNYEADKAEAKKSTDGKKEERLSILKNWMAETYAIMGTALRAENYREMAETNFNKAIELAPENAEVMAATAGLYINDHNPQKVIDLIQQAAKLKPGIEEEESWNLALAHLELGHWHQGFELYHKGVKGKERLNKNYWASGQTPEWDGQLGQTVVVYGEQGIGDEIMFASVLPEFIRDCKHVIFDCHPKLWETFKRSFPNIEIYPTRKVMPEWAFSRTDIEARIAIGSLPHFYRHKDSDFWQHDGYIFADPAKIEYYRGRLGPGPNIGIAWQGGTKKTRFDLRSIAPRKLKSILERKANFISLNYIPEAALEARELGIPHWEEIMDDLDARHALMMACDLIITVNQSLVHEAGALGKQCWTLTPYRCAWRYGLEGTKMIWYPSVTQFRQRENEPWSGAIARLAERLASWEQRYAAGNSSGPWSEPLRSEAGAAD